MNTYKRHRFPPDIISYAVWLYHRFNLSNRDVEDLLAERGISVSYETIRLWCIKFGTRYARRLKQRHRGYGDTLYLDEVFVKINGKRHYLWRAVDQDGEVVDVYLQARRDGAAAKRFFKRLIRSCGGKPRNIVTDKLRSYGVAHRELMPDVIHDTPTTGQSITEISGAVRSRNGQQLWSEQSFRSFVYPKKLTCQYPSVPVSTRQYPHLCDG